jgi:hypothetical protein
LKILDKRTISTHRSLVRVDSPLVVGAIGELVIATFALAMVVMADRLLRLLVVVVGFFPHSTSHKQI